MGKATASKVRVAERALLQRVNRKLRAEHEMLKRCKESSRSYGELGDLYCVDMSRNLVTATHVDLEALGRELGVLQPWETLADEEGR